METIESKLEKFIVVKDIEGNVKITIRDNFKTELMCECHDRFSQKIGCTNSGCYAIDNHYSCAKADMIEALKIKFSDFDFEDFDVNDIEDEEIKKAVENWKSDNEQHTECKAFNWSDNANYHTEFMADDDYSELDSEEQKSILAEFENDIFNNYNGASYTVETENFTFTQTRYSTDPWHACVEYKNFFKKLAKY